MKRCPFLLLLALLLLPPSVHLVAAELPVATPAATAQQWHTNSVAAAAASKAQADVAAQVKPADPSSPWWVKLLAGAGSIAAAVVGVTVTGKAKPLVSLGLRALRMLPAVDAYLSEGETVVSEANAGAAAIASVEVGRDLLRTLDRLVGDGNSIAEAIQKLTGNKASTIEGLFLNGVKTHQVDAGARDAVAALRRKVLDQSATVKGVPTV